MTGFAVLEPAQNYHVEEGQDSAVSNAKTDDGKTTSLWAKIWDSTGGLIWSGIMGLIGSGEKANSHTVGIANNNDIPFDNAQLDALLEDPQEIDWSEFEENMFTSSDPDFARILVKVPTPEKSSIKQEIADTALHLGISDPDYGVLAGQVLKRLLEKVHE